MDSRMRRELDNYITGGRYRDWIENLTCKACGHKWEARMMEEYGMSEYLDEDNICPECGADYESKVLNGK